MKNEINDLLHKNMDRLTFLKHIGVGFVALIGVSSVVKALGGGNLFNGNSQGSADNHNSSMAAGYGYGSSTYGGNKLA